MLPLLVILFFSLSFHEAAHAWMANKWGDTTAKDLGRITLNPLPHIDIFGTVIFPVLLAVMGAPIIGWAKPVPVNFRNLRDRRMGGLWVAAAGPLSNILLAIGFTAIFAAFIRMGDGAWIQSPSSFQAEAINMVKAGVFINLILAMFNLLPFPPLDGSRVLNGLLPQMSRMLDALERYGIIIIFVLFYLHILDYLVFLPAQIVYRGLLNLAI